MISLQWLPSITVFVWSRLTFVNLRNKSGISRVAPTDKLSYRQHRSHSMVIMTYVRNSGEWPCDKRSVLSGPPPTARVRIVTDSNTTSLLQVVTSTFFWPEHVSIMYCRMSSLSPDVVLRSTNLQVLRDHTRECETDRSVQSRTRDSGNPLIKLIPTDDRWRKTPKTVRTTVQRPSQPSSSQM